MALTLAPAACGPREERELRSVGGDCGPPSGRQFHGVHAVMTTPGLPQNLIEHWASGCAVISFFLDPSGRITDPQVVLERPTGNGVANAAITVLRGDIFKANSEQGFDSPALPNQPFAMTAGFGRANGHLIVSKLTVRKYQTIHIGH